MTLSRVIRDCLDRWNEVSRLDYRLTYPDHSVMAETDGFPEDSESESVFLYVQNGKQEPYLLEVKGENPQINMIAELAVCQLETLIKAYHDKNDKVKFWKDVLEGRYNEMEIRNLANQFHISCKVLHAMYLIEVNQEDHTMAISLLRNLFVSKDIIFSINGKRIVILQEVIKTLQPEEGEGTASMLVDMLNTELMIPAKVSYGNDSRILTELSGLYESTCVALEIGKIFYSEKNVFSYHQLGIGRLLYQLPKETCEQFIQEVFSGEKPDSLDDEMLMTIKIFFENNLNLSETSRKLYIHRNTLVYRFEKIQKKFGLDIRVFEDAMIFKLGMMVADYLLHDKMRSDQEIEL